MNKCEVCLEPTPGHVCRACSDDADLGREVRGKRTARFDLGHFSCEDPKVGLEALLLQDGQIVGATYECGHWATLS